MTRPSEDDLIARYFAPLAGEGALQLQDDAAVLTPTVGHDLVLTVDAIVAGVHFLEDDAAGSVARKALAVNLSDLAAKGAAPRGFLLRRIGGVVLRDETAPPRDVELRPELERIRAVPLQAERESPRNTDGNTDRTLSRWSRRLDESGHGGRPGGLTMQFASIRIITDDLDGMVADLTAKGVAILGRQDEDYGRFAWIVDPDGVKVELWQQLGPAPAA